MDIGKDASSKDSNALKVESNHNLASFQESINNLLIRTTNIENNYVPRIEIEIHIEKLLERFESIEKRIVKFEEEITKTEKGNQKTRQGFQNEFQDFIDKNDNENSSTVETSCSGDVVEAQSWKELETSNTSSKDSDDEGIMLSMLKN